MQIREKIGHAIMDMPEHDRITKLLTGASINYFHCLQIVDILKETEADTKNFFGSYGSQRMKDWQEVVALYRKDNVFLAEAAQLLSQVRGARAKYYRSSIRWNSPQEVSANFFADFS